MWIPVAFALVACCLALLGGTSTAKQLYSQFLLSAVPQPKTSSVMGHITEMFKAPSIHTAVYNWTLQLGQMYKLRVLFKPMVVISDPDAANKYLRSLPKYVEFYVNFEKLVQPSLPNILSSPENDYWRAVRRGVAPAFSMANIKKCFPQLVSLTSRIVKHLKEVGPDTTVDMDHAAQRLTIDVIGSVGFDQDYGAVQFQPNEALQVVKLSLVHMQKMLNPLNKLPWSKAAKEYAAVCRRYDALCKGVVDKLLAQPPPPHTLAAHLLKVIDPKTGSPLSPDQLKSEVSIFWIAGFETTAHSISWALLLLAMNPQAESNVLSELSALGLVATADNPNPRDPAWEDLSRIPYLNAVINESMRMMPVVSGGGARYSPKEWLVIHGHRLPPNTQLIFQTYSLHRSPWCWDEPDEFKPERWLSSDSLAAGGGGPAAVRGTSSAPVTSSSSIPATTTSAAVTSTTSADVNPLEGMGGKDKTAAQSGRSYFPFSAGPRDCVGQALALAEMRVALMLLLGRFKFTPAPESGGAQALIDSARQFITLMPQGGMLMRCIPRETL